MIGQMFVLPLAYVALLAPNITASVRRLHDRDRSGWWVVALILGLIGVQIVAFYSAAMFVYRIFLEQFQDGTCANCSDHQSSGDLTSFQVISILALSTLLLPLLFAFVQLCLPGTAGPNRFGPAPSE
jgi:uncharacterized membrane protein YhaH (DUF805 family)